MVAELQLSQTLGGRRHAAIARPKARVESTREARMTRRFAAV
jgi:hypothetical protein